MWNGSYEWWSGWRCRSTCVRSTRNFGESEKKKPRARQFVGRHLNRPDHESKLERNRLDRKLISSRLGSGARTLQRAALRSSGVPIARHLRKGARRGSTSSR